MSIMLPVILLTILSIYLLFIIYFRYQFVRQVNRLPLIFKPCTLGITGNFAEIKGAGILGHNDHLKSTNTHTDHSENDLALILMKIVDCARLYLANPFRPNPGIAAFWIGPTPYVMVISAEVAECVLSNSTNLRKSHLYDLLNKWLGTGLLTAWGNKWKRQRKLLTPAFHFKILGQFVPVMNETAKTLIRVLKEETKETGVIADLREIMHRTTLDVICETAMGEKVDALTNRESEYFKAVDAMGETLTWRTWRPWLRSDLIFGLTTRGQTYFKNLKRIHSFTGKVLKKRKEEIISNMASKSKTKSREPFMDTLLREHICNPTGLSEKDVAAEVDTFMFAGHDTTAWGLTWATVLIGHYPNVQRRLQEEADEMFESLDNGQMTLQDLRTRLRYTEAVVKETLRLYPSVPVIGRTVETDIKVDNRWTIPKGCQVFVCPRAIHRDPKYWTQPDDFVPERWLMDDNNNALDSSLSDKVEMRKRHPFSYIPFSAGVRNCIGQKFAILEMKAVLANIFRHFDVESLDQLEDLKPILSITTKTRVPVRIQLKERSHHVTSSSPP